METTPYILKEFGAFTLETTIAEVKQFFKETTFSHFPVVTNNKLIGLISKNEADEIDENNKEVGYFQYAYSLFFAEENYNLLEILTVFASNESNIIPVLNNEKTYIGYYDLFDILNLINNTPFLQNEGIVLHLEKETNTFSFSEVCQIVETNKGKVFGLFITNSTPSTVNITLKFDSQHINEILQSFRRYNYTVISKHKEDFYLEDLKDRSEYLQKYLNI
jgi:predicted transcriptional regulator